MRVRLAWRERPGVQFGRLAVSHGAADRAETSRQLLLDIVDRVLHPLDALLQPLLRKYFDLQYATLPCSAPIFAQAHLLASHVEYDSHLCAQLVVLGLQVESR